MRNRTAAHLGCTHMTDAEREELERRIREANEQSARDAAAKGTS